MNKYEYVNQIEKALVGKITTKELHETVQYYNDYIDMEIRKGRTEADVLQGLGDPRLIAKNIVIANSDKEKGNQQMESRSGYQEGETGSPGMKSFHVPWILVLIILVLVVLFVVSTVLSIASILLPILFPIAIAASIIFLFKRR